MTYLPLILAVLKVVLNYMKWAHERELISEGYDQAIAKVTQDILRKTETGKKIMERIDAMSDSEIDDALRRLEPL